MLYFEWSPPWHVKTPVGTFIMALGQTVYMTSILAFYLTFFLADINCGFLSGILFDIYSDIVAFCFAHILTAYLTFFSGILFAHIC